MGSPRFSRRGWFALAPARISFLLPRVVPDQIALEWRVIDGVDAPAFLRFGASDGIVLIGGKLIVSVTVSSMIQAAAFEEIGRWVVAAGTDPSCQDPYLDLYCVKQDMAGARREAMKWKRDQDEPIPRIALLRVGLEDEEPARRLLTEVAAHANAADLLVECATAWRCLFEEEREARRCMDLAVERCDKSWDWAAVAAAWNSLGNSSEALLAAERAAGTSPDCNDWLWCASAWAESVGDLAWAGICVERAMDLARDYDWTRIAHTFRSLLNDAVRARECMVKAAASAERCILHQMCGEQWVAILGADGEERASFEAAERAARDSLDWATCACRWKEVVHDEARARQCLKGAERAARGCSDWAICAYNWTMFPDSLADSRRCMCHAERLARSEEDWDDCGRAWEIIGDAERISYCKRKAKHGRPE